MGNRSVPTGLRIDGGSDWICLSRKFVDYISTSQDELVQGLKQYFTYALLPAEVSLILYLRIVTCGGKSNTLPMHCYLRRLVKYFTYALLPAVASLILQSSPPAYQLMQA